MSSDKARIRTCVICKAPARCQNFGATTCEACKAFFRRAHYGDLFKTYRCVNGNNCEIVSDARKSCSFCRYQRCRDAGMDMAKGKNSRGNELQAVGKGKQNTSRGDELELAAQELFQELLTLTSRFTPVVDDKGKFFTMMELFDLDSLTSKYSHSFYNIPFKEDCNPASAVTSLEKSVNVIAAVLHRLIFFCNSITEFTALTYHDRKELFTSACSELCMINTILCFNKEQGIWLAPLGSNSKFYKNVPGVTSELLANILGSDVHREKVDITVNMQQYHPDETAVMLLFAILLFTPNRPRLIDSKTIHKNQIHFALLLKKYLNWRFGARDGDNVFITLTKGLKGFRNLAPYLFEKVHKPLLERSGAFREIVE